MGREYLYIEQVKFSEDFLMDIQLSNQHRIIYDLKSVLNTLRFRDLNNKKLFQSGVLVKQRIIRWNETIELSMEEILYMVNKVRESYSHYDETKEEKKYGRVI